MVVNDLMSMELREYKKKRTLTRTPEPSGGRSKEAVLRFVVQKHKASRLHYDFRLELDGVLKSWAVPKGPSLDTGVKRLAMQVEDHPYDYRSFEGIIPEGNYGAGAVMVWDHGTYHPAEGKATTKREAQNELREQLKKGKLKIILHGEKLNGQFALVKSSYSEKGSWLLMKLKDEFATKDDILESDRSSLSGKSMENIEGKKTSRVAKASKRRVVAPAKRAAHKLKPQGKNSKSDKPSPKAASKSKFPEKISPMLATLVNKPFHADGWVYEVKWDGYRALAFIDNGEVDLRSRNDKSFNDKFYPIHRALAKWKHQAIIDGEIVVLKESGVSDFGALQNWRSEADGHLIYYVFDLLWLDGRDLTRLPLTERQQALRELVPDNGLVRISESFEINGLDFYNAAGEKGLEGIIAKKADSLYLPGIRTTNWLKIKVGSSQEVVIGGYTKNIDTPKQFSALLAGVFRNGKFVYIGKIGTGFNERTQKELMQKFKPHIISKHAFDTLPDIAKPSRFNPRPSRATVTWLKPVLVCEVSFTELTSDGIMRHPSFKGLRIDKKATDVTLEKKASTTKTVRAKTDEHISMTVAPEKSERSSLVNPKNESQSRQVDGHALQFTNLGKIYWPKEKVTKGEMINYYYQVAPFILPYLKDRPQSLSRFPNGITGKSFYQKDVTGKVPSWVRKYRYNSSDKPDVDKHFLVPQSEADVLLMANMGCIEMHPWSSRIQKPDNPDWCLIDLDPDKQHFDLVVEAALVTRDVLADAGIESYCKTSGSTGLHLYIPLGAKYTYEDSKEFARSVVKMVNKEIPKFTTIERTISDRKGKLYLDFLQNRPQATLAAPYSLRPKPGAPVSMPLHWDEVKAGLKITDFTIKNAVARIREMGDIFKPVLGKGVDLGSGAIEKKG